MQPLFRYLGLAAAALGALLCIVSGIARVAGYYYVAGYEATTFFQLGTGVMVFACMMKLYTPRDKQ